MTFRSIPAALLATALIVILAAGQCSGVSVKQPYSRPNFQQLLQKLAAYSPDPCGPPYGREQDWHTSRDEFSLFERAADIVTEDMNATAAKLTSPRDRATESLKRLEKMSAGINVAWPEGNRFHFEILDLAAVLVVKMTFRTHESFFVFGLPENDSGKSNPLWQRVGEGDMSFAHEVPQSWLHLYPLHRGPSGNPRFLAKVINSGCAGSIGVVYEAYEWNQKDSTYIEQIIKQEGAFGLDDKVPGFEQIGKLQTKGPLITLPYCWFSRIDTWDNPSMCAVDTYDISGDKIRFRSRTYNRPDLLPVTKAIEYAEQRDYPALLGYCASAEVARRLVRDISSFVFDDELLVTPTGKGKERVKMGDGLTYYFDVEKHADHWRVIDFGAE